MKRLLPWPGPSSSLWWPLVTLLVLSGAGCAVVKPYQREVLSIRPMDGEAYKVEDRFRQHWGESREGTAGGFSAAGGGCGCN